MLKTTSPPFGFVLGLIVGLAVSMLGVFVNFSAKRHNFADILLFRMFWSSVILLPLVWNSLPKAFSRDAVYIWPRAFFGGCSALCFFYVLTHASIAMANLLANFAPIWVLGLSWAFFSETLTRSQTLGAVIVIAAMLALNLSGAGSITPFVAAVGLTGSLFSALALVSLRQASQKLNLFLIVFFMSAMTALIAIPFSKDPFGAITSWTSVDLWGVALVSLVYQSSMTFQYRFIPAALAIVLNETALVWSIFFDLAFFQHWPSVLELLVVAAVIIGIAILQGFPQWLYRSTRRRPLPR